MRTNRKMVVRGSVLLVIVGLMIASFIVQGDRHTNELFVRTADQALISVIKLMSVPYSKLDAGNYVVLSVISEEESLVRMRKFSRKEYTDFYCVGVPRPMLTRGKMLVLHRV